MGFLRPHLNPDGLPGPYIGDHRRPPGRLELVLKAAARGMGELSLYGVIVVVCVTVPPIFQPDVGHAGPPNRVSDETEIDEAEAKLFSLVTSGGEVSYLPTSKATSIEGDRYCITNPALIMSDLGVLWAGMGRTDSRDPETGGVIVLGRVSIDEAGEVRVGAVTWSAELGSFATAEGTQVGAGRRLEAGEEC